MIIPPIKSQGIKTKLVPWIIDVINRSGIDPIKANWIEPFLGTGVVGFNSPLSGKHIAGDTNPHIITFYNKVKAGVISGDAMRQYLKYEGKILEAADEDGYAHFRNVRDRFNRAFDSFDFIFLSRAGFNGLMRFNNHGKWNVPFCKKPERFSPAYITKICNQIDNVASIIHIKDWTFLNQHFLDTILLAKENDIIYCDPPYLGRYVDYYNGWTKNDEFTLYDALCNTKAKFILSTWHHNEYRKNEMINQVWNKFNIETKEHFYHGGAYLENRHAMTEALVFNFDLQSCRSIKRSMTHPSLFGNYSINNKLKYLNKN